MLTAEGIKAKIAMAEFSMRAVARAAEYHEHANEKLLGQFASADAQREEAIDERDVYKQKCEDLNERLERLHASADQWEAQAMKIPMGCIISTAILSPLILCLAWVLFTIAVHFAK